MKLQSVYVQVIWGFTVNKVNFRFVHMRPARCVDHVYGVNGVN